MLQTWNFLLLMLLLMHSFVVQQNHRFVDFLRFFFQCDYKSLFDFGDITRSIFVNWYGKATYSTVELRWTKINRTPRVVADEINRQHCVHMVEFVFCVCVWVRAWYELQATTYIFQEICVPPTTHTQTESNSIFSSVQMTTVSYSHIKIIRLIAVYYMRTRNAVQKVAFEIPKSLSEKFWCVCVCVMALA